MALHNLIDHLSALGAQGRTQTLGLLEIRRPCFVGRLLAEAVKLVKLSVDALSGKLANRHFQLCGCELKAFVG